MSKRNQIILNYLGFFVLAGSGLMVNLLVSLYYSAKHLGIFNVSYAVFVVLSQICTFGFHISTLRYFVKYPSQDKKILTVSTISVLSISIVVGMALVLLRDFLGVFWDEKSATSNLKYIALATASFSVNKVMMWALNAKEYMSAYASFQILRGAGVLGGCLFLVFQRDFPPYLLFVCVLIGESIVTVGLVIYCSKRIGFGVWRWRLFRILFLFSRKSVPVGMIAQVNYKVDVLCVGYFLNDSLTGVYSFMALFVDGLLSSITVLRSFINPKIAAVSGSVKGIIELQREYRLPITLCGVLLMGIIWGGYLGYLHFFDVTEVYREYAYVLILLVAVPSLLASLWPFDQIFVYKGSPEIQTKYLTVVLITNLVLNLISIPLFSLWGAAAATGISMLVGQAYFNLRMKKEFGRSFLF